MRAIIILALKDLRLLVRDKFGLFWLLAFPLMMALFFGSIFAGGPSGRSAMRVAVVDLDNTEFSREFITNLDASSALRVARLPEDSAREIVRRGKAVAYLIIQPGFGKMENMFNGDTSTTLITGIDPSRQAEAGYLQGLIMQAWFSRVKSLFSDPTMGRGQIDNFMAGLRADSTLPPDQRRELESFFGSLDNFFAQMDTGALAGDQANAASSDGFMNGPRIHSEDVAIDELGPASSWEITFPQALLWALIGCTAAFAITVVNERTRGTLLRLRLSPLSRGQVLAGKGLACFVAAVSVCVLLLAFGKFVFAIRTPDYLALGLAITCSAICFVGLMMLISVIGKTEQAVAGAGWGILLVFSMTGGGMVPLMVMPKWMITMSHISPVKWGIYALEGAIWRDFSPMEMLLPLSILTAVGVVTFTIGVIVFRKTIN